MGHGQQYLLKEEQFVTVFCTKTVTWLFCMSQKSNTGNTLSHVVLFLNRSSCKNLYSLEFSFVIVLCD